MTNTANANALIIPGTHVAPAEPMTLIIPGSSPVTVDSVNGPRGPVAADVATRAAESARAGYVVDSNPDTIQTWRGNYIVPAAKTGHMTCPVCATELPVTKFPTRAPAADGTVVRDRGECRRCRDARVAAGAPRTYRADGSPVAATVPVAAPTATDRWDAATPGVLPVNTVTAARDTDAAMGATDAELAAWDDMAARA